MLKLFAFLYSIFRLARALAIIVLILFGIVMVGELTHCSGSSTPDNAVHWRP